MADALMEYETLSAEQIDDIMVGAKPRAPGGDGPSTSARTREEGPRRREGDEPAPNIGGPAEEH
jgi:hypothetical protein